MKLLFFVFLLLIYLPVNSQVVTWDSVRPSTTDNNIETGAYNLRHYMATSNAPSKNTLVVFLPGTNRAPSSYLYMMEQIALLGYHVIGLMYKTDPAIVPICRPTDDVTCHWRARMKRSMEQTELRMFQ